MPSARCSRSVGVVPPPSGRSTSHGIGDPDPPLERLGVVVGHLVRRHVGPHLQHARADVPRARAREQDAQRERGGRGGTVTTSGGLSLRRRRTSGAATPAASTVRAAARMAVERRTAPESSARARATAYGSRSQARHASRRHGRSGVHRRGRLPPPRGRRRRARSPSTSPASTAAPTSPTRRDGRRARRAPTRVVHARRAVVRARRDGRARARQHARHAQRARRGGRPPRRRARLGRRLGLRVHARARRGRRPPRPCGIPYIDTKGATETLALRRGATVIRPGDVYGPRLAAVGRAPAGDDARRTLLPARAGRRRDHAGLRRRPRGRDRARAREPRAAGRAYTIWDGDARHGARVLRPPRPQCSGATEVRVPARAAADAALARCASAAGPAGAHVPVPPRDVPEHARPRGAGLEPARFETCAGRAWARDGC